MDTLRNDMRDNTRAGTVSAETVEDHHDGAGTVGTSSLRTDVATSGDTSVGMAEEWEELRSRDSAVNGDHYLGVMNPGDTLRDDFNDALDDFNNNDSPDDIGNDVPGIQSEGMTTRGTDDKTEGRVF